jgi:hypothetical protein
MHGPKLCFNILKWLTTKGKNYGESFYKQDDLKMIVN